MPGEWVDHDAGPSSDPDRGLAQDENHPEQTEQSMEPEKTKQQKENERKARQKKERQARQRAEQQASVNEPAMPAMPAKSSTVAEWEQYFEFTLAQVKKLTKDPTLSKAQKNETMKEWIASVERLGKSKDFPNAAAGLRRFRTSTLPQFMAGNARRIKENEAKQRVDKQAYVDENVDLASLTIAEWTAFFSTKQALADELLEDPSLSMAQKQEQQEQTTALMDQLGFDFPNAAVALQRIKAEGNQLAYWDAVEARHDEKMREMFDRILAQLEQMMNDPALSIEQKAIEMENHEVWLNEKSDLDKHAMSALRRLTREKWPGYQGRTNVVTTKLTEPEPRPEVAGNNDEAYVSLLVRNYHLHRQRKDFERGRALEQGPSIGLAGWKFDMIPERNSSPGLSITSRVEQPNPTAGAQKPKDKGKGKAVDDPVSTRQASEPTPTDEPQTSTAQSQPSGSTSEKWQATTLRSGRVVSVSHQRMKVKNDGRGLDAVLTQLAAEASSGSQQPPLKPLDILEAPGLSMSSSPPSSSTNAQRVNPTNVARPDDHSGSTTEVWQYMTLPYPRSVSATHQLRKLPARIPSLRVSTGHTDPKHVRSGSATSPLRHEVLPESADNSNTPELLTGSSDPNSSAVAEPVTPDNAASFFQRRISESQLYRDWSGYPPPAIEFRAGVAPAHTKSIPVVENPVAALDRCHNACIVALEKFRKIMHSSRDEAGRERSRRLRSLEGEKRVLVEKLRAEEDRRRALDWTIRDLKRSQGTRPNPKEPDPADTNSDGDGSDSDDPDKHDPDEHSRGKSPSDGHRSDKHEADEPRAEEHRPDEHRPNEHKLDEHQPDESRPQEHQADDDRSDEHKRDEQQTECEKETTGAEGAADKLPKPEELQPRSDQQPTEQEEGAIVAEIALPTIAELDGLFTRLDAAGLKGKLTSAVTSAEVEILEHVQNVLLGLLRQQTNSGILIVLPQVHYLHGIMSEVIRIKADPSNNSRGRKEQFRAIEQRVIAKSVVW